MTEERKDPTEGLGEARFRFLEARNRESRLRSELIEASNSLTAAAKEYQAIIDKITGMAAKDGVNRVLG